MNKNSEYLEAIISGDSNTVAALYSNNLPRVIKFVCQNKGNKYDAEEVFQNALLQLAVRYKHDKFEIRSSFEAYLFTVCKNLWRRELNRKKKEVTKNNITELKDEGEDFANAILEQKQWELYNEAFNKLSDNCQEILKLFFKKFSYQQMLEILDYKSENVIKQRVFKCKSKLKSMIVSDKRYKELK